MNALLTESNNQQPQHAPLLLLAARLGRKLQLARVAHCTEFIIENACNGDLFACSQVEKPQVEQIATDKI